MKIAVISDIHYAPHNYFGVNKKEHREFSKKINAHKPDILLVCGDCAEGSAGKSNLVEFLNIYKNNHGESLLIPGNHDVWNSDQELAIGTSTSEKYDDFFKTANENGWIGLREAPYSKDGVYIAGNMAWYDFSMINPDTYNTPMSYEKERDWSDYRFMGLKTHPSETPMLDYCSSRMWELDNALKQVPSDRKCLIMATHIVGFQRLLPKHGSKDYGRPFFGNENIGKLVCKYDADYYFCGHSHTRVESAIGKMKCINNGSDYYMNSKKIDIIEV